MIARKNITEKVLERLIKVVSIFKHKEMFLNLRKCGLSNARKVSEA